MNVHAFIRPPADFQPDYDGVAVFVWVKDRVLALQRVESALEGGTWDVPAGKAHAGERPMDAAVRELWEESGIEVKADQLEPLHRSYLSWEDMRAVQHMFRLRLESRPPITLNPAEHQRFEWLTVDEFQTRPRLAFFVKHFKLFPEDLSSGQSL